MLSIILCFCVSAVLSCAPDEFQCRDKTCITQNFRCDKFEDCKDGSDEIGCLTLGCKPYEFRCGDGMCITNAFRCDNFEDCKDGSDEIGCDVKGELCTKACKEPILLYEDLGCKPKYLSHHHCCPSEYVCSHIERRANLVEEKCYFRGKGYNLGATITSGEIYGTCYSNCTCQKTKFGSLSFSCNLVKCPEWYVDRLKPGCHLKYDIGKCCSTGEVCGPSHTSCMAGGKIYYEGQRYESPVDKCKYCVCKRSLLDNFESSHCSKYQCMQEIHHHKKIVNFCAPSYLTMDDCCPINWICPKNDEIIVAKIKRKPKIQCKFGNLQLNIGDKFKRIHKPSGGKVWCECRIPPYLTCIQDYTYPTNDV